MLFQIRILLLEVPVVLLWEDLPWVGVDRRNLRVRWSVETVFPPALINNDHLSRVPLSLLSLSPLLLFIAK